MSMLKQAMELKSKMQKVQKELGKTKVEATAGDGMVKVVANGQQKILSIKIDPCLIDPQHVDKLEKMVLKGVVSALEESKKLANEKLGALTGGMKIPGLTD